MTADRDLGLCSHGCGREAEKISSGSPECWPCWNRRKLDLPAARHWARVADEFLSNVDFYDLQKFLPACGLTDDEVSTMLLSAKKVKEYSKMIEARYGPVPPTTEGETNAVS